MSTDVSRSFAVAPVSGEEITKMRLGSRAVDCNAAENNNEAAQDIFVQTATICWKHVPRRPCPLVLFLLQHREARAHTLHEFGV